MLGHAALVAAQVAALVMPVEQTAAPEPLLVEAEAPDPDVVTAPELDGVDASPPHAANVSVVAANSDMHIERMNMCETLTQV